MGDSKPAQQNDVYIKFTNKDDKTERVVTRTTAMANFAAVVCTHISASQGEIAIFGMTKDQSKRLLQNCEALMAAMMAMENNTIPPKESPLPITWKPKVQHVLEELNISLDSPPSQDQLRAVAERMQSNELKPNIRLLTPATPPY